MQGLLKGLKVHMSMGNALESARAYAAPVDNAIGRLAQTRGMATLPDDLARKVQGSFHPLVRTHPRTGERALYCDQTYAAGIEGLQPQEAAPILKFLVEHACAGPFRTPIPGQAEHPFRRKPNTDSGPFEHPDGVTAGGAHPAR
jgi:taurine dioxygenase